MFDLIKDAKTALAPVIRDASPDIAQDADALLKLFEIVKATELESVVLEPDEITDIGMQGLALIDDLTAKLVSQQRETDRQQVEQASLVIAQWVITHEGVVTNLQSIVSALAYLSNSISNTTQLGKLAMFMGQVVKACSESIQRDLDTANSDRPWRLLNINRGITVTRSHDLALMRQTFMELIPAIPMDAPVFFEEAMTEMERLNYPQPVRELVQAFYQRVRKPLTH